MGFFSWITQDTNRSIANTHSSMETFSVTMTDNHGNKWHEENYEGYGKFDGKDYYELLAEMNGKKGRMEGINLSHSGKPHIAPNLTERKDHLWEDEKPESCPYQGYFY